MPGIRPAVARPVPPRRRLGPFRAAPLASDDPAAARREQAVLARAGFAESVVSTRSGVPTGRRRRG